MSRPTKADQERGYLKAFWDEVRTIEADYTGSVTMFVTPERRPGVMQWRLVFVSLLNGDENALNTASYQFLFPTASNVILAGTLWSGARVLHDLVRDAHERTALRPKNGG